MRNDYNLILMIFGVAIGAFILVFLLKTIDVGEVGKQYGRFVGLLQKSNRSYVGELTTTTTTTTTTIPILEIILRELCSIARVTNSTNITYGNINCFRTNSTCLCYIGNNTNCYVGDQTENYRVMCIKILK